MLGMHGSVYANYAVDEADLLIAVGVRFDDHLLSFWYYLMDIYRPRGSKAESGTISKQMH